MLLLLQKKYKSIFFKQDLGKNKLNIFNKYDFCHIYFMFRKVINNKKL